MKTTIKTFLLVMMLAVASPSFSAIPKNTSVEYRERADQLESRLKEIREMDAKTLSKSEKRALRGEVKAIKKELKAIGGGVYLSAGALILIVLLLILLV